MKRIFGAVLLSISLLIGNSCSTGSDPEPQILDVFAAPTEIVLQIQNICNDIAMDVNGIAMHNLEFEKDTIQGDDIATCLDALVYRNSSALDSIVLNYGTSNCASNGGSFIGKMIVEPTGKELKSFDIQLIDFSSQSITIEGLMNFQITSDKAGEDFNFEMSNAQFSITGSDTLIYTFQVSSISNSYEFIDGGEDDEVYTDDVFDFTTNLSGVTPEGNSFTLESTDDFTYAYSCKNIIGGKANYTLENVGDGSLNYGEGNLEKDCDDSNVIITTAGYDFTIKL